jgi:hypothetical protein
MPRTVAVGLELFSPDWKLRLLDPVGEVTPTPDFPSAVLV